MPDCERCRESVSAMLDGELDGAGRDAVMAHLASCPDCRAYCEDIRAIRAMLAPGEDETAPAGLAERVAALAAAEPRKNIDKKWRAPWVRYAALAACCAVLALGAWGYSRSFSGTDASSADTAPENGALYAADADAGGGVPETAAGDEAASESATEAEKELDGTAATAEAGLEDGALYAADADAGDEAALESVAEAAEGLTLTVSAGDAGPWLETYLGVVEAAPGETYALSGAQYDALRAYLDERGAACEVSRSGEGGFAVTLE